MAAKIFLQMSGGGKMPAIGLGTGVLKDEPALEKALEAALEAGYRHIDTAFIYQNEVFIGRVLKRWFSSGKLKREDIFITTKLPPPGLHQDRVEMFMKKSLENLQLDYVDLYLIHFPVGTKYVEGQRMFAGGRIEGGGPPEIDDFDHVAVWKKMEEQVDAGRSKAIGLSNFTKKQIERILKSARIKPACQQIEVRVDFQQRDLINFCRQNGMVVVAYSPLGAPGRAEPRKVPPVIHNEVVNKIAKKYHKTCGQILLRYLVQNNIAAIPKSENPERIKENIDIFDFNIDPSDLKALDDLEEGEDARRGLWKFVPGIEQHPEYPFPVRS